MSPLQFTSWYPLSRAGIDEFAPREPAAIQVRVEDGLVDYPSGRSSAMVCYFYAGEDAHEAIERLFEDEIDSPGARGQGALLFRYITGGDEVLEHLKRLLYRFHAQFDEMPLFNQKGGG